MEMDTIVALATPPGRGGVAVVRISGNRVKTIAQTLLGQVPPPRKACFSSFRDQQNQTIDQGIAIFFPNPQSFTGEDVLELQGHGGPIIINLLIQRLLSLGARLAKPGEFSERAFLNGKMDLAQAEAVADLINASTERAARSALLSLQGEFSQRIHHLVEALIQLRVYIEAAIDFAEEEIDFLSDQAIKDRFRYLQTEIVDIQKNARQGSLLREGIQVVIVGKPNVGKSTLLNLLSGKELAIVTDIPGTTRDTLRDTIQIDGIPLHLIDTAGLRETQDPIEQEGIRRTQQEIKKADLVLYLVSATDTDHFHDLYHPRDLCHPRESGDPSQIDSHRYIVVRNKIDLLEEEPSLSTKNEITIASLSAKNNTGIDLLKQAIKANLGFYSEQESIFSARQRHLDAIEKAKQALQTAFHQLQTSRAGELIAEDLRQAQHCLSEITGAFTTEDLLGRIFASFCIGK